MTEIRVRTREGTYPVLVGSGLLGQIPGLLAEHVAAERFALISDDNVAPIYGESVMEACRAEGLDAALFTFPAGEASKTRKSWSILTDELLEARYGRDSCVVAIGGGVTTDLGGFVAATFLRGVPAVQVPTSYLAMIDASVGGKTGVDAKAGKNLVGAFHAPRLVVADPEALATLPREERAQGLVEAFKHGAVLDAGYFADLQVHTQALLDARPAAAGEAVARSVALKGEVVSEDELEKGYRQVLNFGHTLGHALEAASGYAWGHGTAVAVGMRLEAELGERMGVTEAGTRAKLAAALDELLGQPPELPAAASILPYLGADKKTRGGKPRVVLLERLGAVAPGEGWSHELSEDLIVEAFGAALEAR